MGNRAVITASTSKTSGIGIYLHWNGGLESILAFLSVCKDRGYRTPAGDEAYAMARLTGVIHEFIGGGASIGIGTLKNLDTDNHDNGVYVIGGNWEVVKRWGAGSSPSALDASFLDEQETAKSLAIYTKINAARVVEA